MSITKPSCPLEPSEEELIKKHERIEPYQLYSFDEVPPWIADNQYIRTHYRAYFSFSDCVRSLFRLHNETGNIYTHLLGFFFFIGLGIYVFKYVIVSEEENEVNFIMSSLANSTTKLLSPLKVYDHTLTLRTHYIIFITMTLGSMGCMLCSAMFHLFFCHYKYWVMKKVHALDFFGITLLIVASFVPMAMYIFSCDAGPQVGYLATIIVLGCGGMILPMLDFFHKDYFYYGRLSIYVCMVASGGIPSIHAYLMLPKNSATLPLIWGVCQMFALYGIGCVIYATRFPERFLSGGFDLFLHSHQLWHIFVFLAAVTHYFTYIGLYRQWNLNKGYC